MPSPGVQFFPHSHVFASVETLWILSHWVFNGGFITQIRLNHWPLVTNSTFRPSPFPGGQGGWDWPFQHSNHLCSLFLWWQKAFQKSLYEYNKRYLYHAHHLHSKDFRSSVPEMETKTKYVFLFFFFFISWRLIALQYCSGFCHTLTRISHGFTCIPHTDTPLPPPSPSHPSGSSQCTSPEHLSHVSNLGWWSVSHLIVYLFQCYSLRTSHLRLLPQSPKVCSVHLCLFFCFAYRVIITIF